MKKLAFGTRAFIQKRVQRIFKLALTGLVVMVSLSAGAATPKISKSFNPSTISTNEFATLNIGFLNPNYEDARILAPFVEKLPHGMFILGSASTSCGGKLTAEIGSSKITLADGIIPAYSACQILVGVTSSKVGSFESKTEVSALQTDKGSNIFTSDATLTVSLPVPMDLRIRKSFNPSIIKPNEFTTLSIALTNPNNEGANLDAPLSEYLPEGMVILGSSSTTCIGKLTAQPGTSKIVLADAKIPANSFCEILLGVTAPELITANIEEGL